MREVWKFANIDVSSQDKSLIASFEQNPTTIATTSSSRSHNAITITAARSDCTRSCTRPFSSTASQCARSHRSNSGQISTNLSTSSRPAEHACSTWAWPCSGATSDDLLSSGPIVLQYARSTLSVPPKCLSAGIKCCTFHRDQTRCTARCCRGFFIDLCSSWWYVLFATFHRRFVVPITSTLRSHSQQHGIWTQN